MRTFKMVIKEVESVLVTWLTLFLWSPFFLRCLEFGGCHMSLRMIHPSAMRESDFEEQPLAKN